MADFSFISTARFRPFSYQEMLQPLQAYTQEYNTIEEGMGELAAKADVFKQLANEQTDPVSHAMYKKYADDLSDQVGSLAREGLTPLSKQGLLNMKRRYSSEIIPIEQAYQNRQKLADWWRGAKLKDPSLLANIDPSTMSLDSFLQNPNIAPQYYSGEKLKSDVFQLAQQFARTVREDERKGRWLLGDQYYDVIKKTGFKPDEVLKAIQGSKTASAELKRLVEDAVSSAGIKSWADKPTQERFYDWANQGLWGALGTTDYRTLTNQAYKGSGSGSSEDNIRVPYTSIARLTVDGNVKTTELDNERKMLQEIMKDMNLLKVKKTRYKAPTGYTTSPGTGVPAITNQAQETETYYPYLEEWNKLSTRYNTKDPQEVMKALTNDIKRAAIVNRDYFMKYTDYKPVTETVKRNVEAQGDNATVYEVKKGNKRGDLMSSSNIEELMQAKDGNIMFSPSTGDFIYKYTTSKGKSKSAILETELLDDSERSLFRAKRDLKEALERDNHLLAGELIKFIMGQLDNTFNSRAKVQSTTDNKLVPTYPEINVARALRNGTSMYPGN